MKMEPFWFYRPRIRRLYVSDFPFLVSLKRSYNSNYVASEDQPLEFDDTTCWHNAQDYASKTRA